MAETTFISKETKELIEKIDNKKFLGLNKEAIERIDLYMFAVGLGLLIGKVNDFNKSTDLVKETSIHGVNNAAIMAQYIAELLKEETTEGANDKRKAFKFTDDYANSGFQTLAGIINQKEEAALFDLIAILDKKYEELIKQ